MVNKNLKMNIALMSQIELYKFVLEGKKLQRFPKGFWQQPEALDNAKVLTKYLIEEVLKWNDEQIKSNIDFRIFYDNKLRGMFLIVFRGNVFDTLNNAYPNKFKEWEFKHTPSGYWSIKENAINAVKWLFEEKLKWGYENIKSNVSKNLFADFGLKVALEYNFNASPYVALKEVYPEQNWECLRSKMKI